MEISLLILLTLGVQCVVGVASNSHLKCTHSAKFDLQLIVDSSGSVEEKNFHLMMQEIADDVVGQFDIGKDKTRVSLFKYSSPKVMVEEFGLDTYSDAASLNKAIKAVKYEPGWTSTGQAMEKALAPYSAKMRKEKEIAKVCIVFTDDKANDQAKIPAALKAWEKKGVTVFALGIGEKMKDAGLEDITGSKDRSITVSDFNAIGKAADSLLDSVCKVIPAKPAGNKCKVKMQSSDLIKASYSGKPGASTEWRDDHSAAHAFKPQTGWPWASKDLPATIWYNFNHSFRLAKISFTSRKSLWSQTPKTFEIVGSNDCSNWDVLMSVSNAGFTDGSQTKAWEISCEKQKSYKCYGIKASAPIDPYWKLVSLANIQMYHLPGQ